MIHMYCTECPNECYLSVEGNQENLEIRGYKCPNGLKFAQEEVTCPKRVLTSTVFFRDEDNEGLLPVRTDRPVPLSRQEELMGIINQICVQHSVKRGDVIVRGIGGLEADLIASASI